MDTQQAKEEYQRAEKLCKAGQFQEALDILEPIMAALPGSRRLIYQRAQCLIGLDRFDEARTCCDELVGKLEERHLTALREKIAKKEQSAQAVAAAPAEPAPAPTPTPTPAAPQPAEGASNVFQVDSVFPLSTEETTITGTVTVGAFYTGDTVSIISPGSPPSLAPIVRIGSAETPIRVLRQGQNGMMVLRVESQMVAPGARVTSSGSADAYAETMVMTDPTEAPPAGTPTAGDPALQEAEKLLNDRNFGPAQEKLLAYLQNDPFSGAAHRLLARIHLEGDAELSDNKKALEHIQKAYELGGDRDPAVLETLAKVLGADGQPDHGIRYLERLYTMATTDDGRESVAERIAAYRSRFRLGDIWEFMNSWGDVIKESSDIEEIRKALENKSIPQDAKCRKNKTGEWKELQEELLEAYPDLASALGKPKSGGGGLIGAILNLFRKKDKKKK